MCTVIQEDEEEFPPKDSSIPDDCIPVPRVCWSGMLPNGLNRLLPLTLWLCIQYLGKYSLCSRSLLLACISCSIVVGFLDFIQFTDSFS